jgi:hypothetical protein
MKTRKVLAIAVGLPSSIIAVSAFAIYLKDKELITSIQSIAIIVTNIFLQLFLMVVYANKKSD